jgi:uncharacterized membrane protein HdeD (DUF308 family)
MAQSEAALSKEAAGKWWWFIITGILWLIISVMVLRVDTPTDVAKSLTAIGALLGAVLVVAGVNEFMVMAMRPGWKWVHAILGILFIVGGIWAFAHPIGAFWELASILGFLLILKGTFDLTAAIVTRQENDVWWLGLIVGILEILLAFWVSTPSALVNETRRMVFLIVWVGFAAMFRGIGELIMAAQLHKLSKQA